MNLQSFIFAYRGLRAVVASETNFRIHLVAACLVMTAGLITGLTISEWCLIAIVIFFVLAMEAMNTAVEKLVDFISPGFHQQAGVIKDIAAAAVLLAALAAVCVGLMIFLPKLF